MDLVLSEVGKSKADVMANLDKLRCYGIPLTDREYAILAVCVTEMQVAGYRPFEDHYCIQVDS